MMPSLCPSGMNKVERKDDNDLHSATMKWPLLCLSPQVNGTVRILNSGVLVSKEECECGLKTTVPRPGDDYATLYILGRRQG